MNDYLYEGPRFGVTARHTEWDGEERWAVYLPHQCEEWDIGESYGPATYLETRDALVAFIAELQEALAALSEEPA